MKNLLLLIFCIALQPSAGAQDFFRVTEKDQDGKWRNADGTAKTDYINNKIADINSVLMIDLLPDRIAASVPAGQGLTDELSDKISALTQALSSQKQTLLQIDNLYQNLDYSALQDQPDKLYSQLRQLQILAQHVDDIALIDSRIEDLADALSTGPEDMYASNYKAAAQILAKEQANLAQYAKAQGISIKFGAWLITKSDKIPLHIDGFDNLPPQQQYEVERWALVLTAQQKQDLAAASQLARENRDIGLTVLEQMAEYQISRIREILWTEYDGIMDQLKVEIQHLGTDSRVRHIAADAQTLLADIAQFKAEAQQRASYYKNLKKPKGEQIAAVASKISDDIAYFAQSLEHLKNSALSLKSDINEAAASLSPKIRQTLAAIGQDLNARLQQVKGLDSNAVQAIIEGRRLDAAALEFSDAVLKLSLDSAKKNFEFDLINSGYREDGNRIAFKLSVFDSSGPAPVQEQVKEIYLFKVLTHVISTVGIVFADPFTPTAIQAQFQMAPYYNLLFKGWIDAKQRRRSIAYNRFLDWGVGLHLSAPDFDKDDVPELGAGVVITALHDYVQTGVAYNIFTSDPYWFFGLRIPMPTFGTNN